MDNKTAFGLGFLMICFLSVDYVYYDMSNSLYLFTKLASLIDHMAFWR